MSTISILRVIYRRNYGKIRSSLDVEERTLKQLKVLEAREKEINKALNKLKRILKKSWDVRIFYLLKELC